MTQKEINYLFAGLYLVLFLWAACAGVYLSGETAKLNYENEAMKQFILRGCK